MPDETVTGVPTLVPGFGMEVDVIRVSTFVVGVSVLVAGCAGVPTGPDGNENLLSATRGTAISAVAASLEPTLEHPVTPPATVIVAPPTSVPSPPVSTPPPPAAAPAPAAPAVPSAPPAASAPAPNPPAAPAVPPVSQPPDGPCGAIPCAPPITLTCPPGLVPTPGVTLTCQAPVPTLTCPAGKHAVLADTGVSCVAD
jgi:hypothetical protein